ncbi:MAG: DUF1223 domain-containing protein [Sphingomonas sp.]
MKTIVALMLSSLAIASCSSSASGGSAASAAEPTFVSNADAAHPAVVELYQSQGCSSCPPADVNVNAIAGRPDIIALSFAVTYWDQLGWKDSFGKPAFTARQWDYAHAGGRGEVATPQVVINGRGAVVGNNAAQLAAAIRANARGADGPSIALSGAKVVIGKATAAQPATVWLVRYDSRTLSVAIRAGENGGKTLPHRNIVRSLDALGGWTGGPITLAVPAVTDPNYRSAILVQEGKGGRIIAASRI